MIDSLHFDIILLDVRKQATIFLVKKQNVQHPLVTGKNMILKSIVIKTQAQVYMKNLQYLRRIKEKIKEKRSEFQEKYKLNF